MYNVQALKADLTGVLHGTQLNQITGLDNLINRAARQLLLDIDPQETKRTLEFVNPIFNTVYDYPIASDVKGNKLIDIKPQVKRLPLDTWKQTYNQAFDVIKNNIFSQMNMFTMNFNSSIKTIRINSPFLNPPVIINNIESITNNGTWVVGGNASNLAVNNTNFVQGASSLQFDTTIGASYIENSTMTEIDLSKYVNQSSIFVWVYVPTGTDLSSVNIRFGSDASNYYSLSVTTNQEGTAFINGWNLCQFPWASMSQTLNPDTTKINYARVTLNTITSNMTACKVNGLNSILGTIMEYEYYSKFLFRNASTGSYQETVLDDSDLINLDTESYNLLTNKVAEFAVQQQQGLDAQFFDSGYFKNEYNQGIMKYKSMYKSELSKPQSQYYTMPNKRWGRFIGRNW